MVYTRRVSYYPVTLDIQVRFRDLDPLGHVNNAVYLSYFELARVKYFQSLGLETTSPHGLGEAVRSSYVVARVEVDFVRPVHLDEPVRINSRVLRVGDKSFRMGHQLLAKGELAAKSEVVVVWLEAEKPARVPDVVRQAFKKLEKDPVEGL